MNKEIEDEDADWLQDRCNKKIPEDIVVRFKQRAFDIWSNAKDISFSKSRVQALNEVVPNEYR